jgi:glycine/D-amino acid oxidase-like deaminating enzyme
MAQTHQAGIVVVGGGLPGRAIAHALAEAGHTIAIVYPEQTHGQASAAAGGMFGVFSEVTADEAPAARDAAVAHRWLSRQLYGEWVARLSEQSGLPVFMREGLLVIGNAVGDDDSRELDAIAAAAEGVGSRVERVSPRTLTELQPKLGMHPFDSLYLPDEGCVDTVQLLAVLETCLLKMPNVTVIHAELSRLNLHDQGVSAILSSGETVDAAQAVIAVGAWTSGLLHASGLDYLNVPPIFSGRGVSLMVETALTFQHPIRTPNRGFACGLHLVPRADGVVYIGATNRFSTTPDFERKPSFGEVNNLLVGAMQEFHTGFREAGIMSMALGHRPIPLDKIPLVGRTNDPRLLVATGTYRNGVLLTPLLAKLIAEEIAQPYIHAAHPFAPNRQMTLESEVDRANWLRQVSASLMSTLLEPNGTLPNGRDLELRQFFISVFNVLLDPQGDHSRLTAKIERLMARAPVEESIPLLFEMIARHSDAKPV